MRKVGQLQFFLLFVIICGCSQTFEVEKHQAAIVISPFYENKVFKEGSYRIGAGNGIIFYNLHSTKIDFDFDFLYRNATYGHMKFALTYSPVADSVYNFYEQYQVNDVDLVVGVEVKAIIRSLMEEVEPGELTRDEVHDQIMSAMNSKDYRILNYVIIEGITNFNIGDGP